MQQNRRSNNFNNNRGGNRGGYQGRAGSASDNNNFRRGLPNANNYRNSPSSNVGGPSSDGTSTIFKLNIKPESYVYLHDVSISYDFNGYDKDSGNYIRKEMSLTSTRKARASRQFCYSVITHLLDENFHDIGFAYNSASMLYSNRPIEAFTTTVNAVEYNFPTDHFRNQPIDGVIKVSISPCNEPSRVNLSNLDQYLSEDVLLTEDRTLRQIFEIILSQNPINSGLFSVVGSGYLYRVQENQLIPAFCTRLGSHRGVRIVDTSTDDRMKVLTPVIVMDSKESLFYRTGNFRERIMEYMDYCRNRRDMNGDLWDSVENAFYGVRLSPIYRPNYVFPFTGFTDNNIAQMTIPQDDGSVIRFIDYYREVKNQPLDHVNDPAACSKKESEFFPLELLEIIPDQKVNRENVPSHVMELVHRRNAIPPEQRWRKILNEFEALDFNNEITRSFGISVEMERSNGIDVHFDNIQKPAIQTGLPNPARPNENGGFFVNKYLKGANVNKWAVLCNDSGLTKYFMERFMEEGTKLGINFSSKAVVGPVLGLIFTSWDEQFTKLKNDGFRFVVLIDDNEAAHGMLKLMQTRHLLRTQHILASTVREKFSNSRTIQNVLHKTNIRNSGINYKPLFNSVASKLDINSGKVLVMGYDVSHPTGITLKEKVEGDSKPKSCSVVGFTANVGVDPSFFTGDFFFQEARREAVDDKALTIKVKNILKSFKERHGKSPGFKMPETFVILRDGLSEGQFKMAHEEECQAIRRGCFQFDQSYKPKLLFIIVTKNHHKKLFAKNQNHLKNPQPGSVVTREIVRPDCMEFFMASHKANDRTTIQFVQVSVILNEINATIEEIKHFLHTLCYSHQIVTSPTSLPTPIFLADELAAHGADLLNALRIHCPGAIPASFMELTVMLSFSKGSDALLPPMRLV